MADNKNQNNQGGQNKNGGQNSKDSQRVKNIPSTQTPSTQYSNRKDGQSCK